MDERTTHELFLASRTDQAEEAVTLLEHVPPSGMEGEATNADVAVVVAAVLESEQRIIAAIREMVEAMGRQSRLMAFSLVGAITANTVLVLAALRLGT